MGRVGVPLIFSVLNLGESKDLLNTAKSCTFLRFQRIALDACCLQSSIPFCLSILMSLTDSPGNLRLLLGSETAFL
jgi:hypothetical protein